MILTSLAILIHLAVDVSLLYVVNENAREDKSNSVIARWYLFPAALYTYAVILANELVVDL